LRTADLEDSAEQLDHRILLRFTMANGRKRLDPIHPGEILLEEFMKPMEISINRLARDIVVPPGRISAIVSGKRSISADTALRLGIYFGISPQTWMGLQAEYDLRVTQLSVGAELAKRVQRHVP
jgi:addiction module HigA family antidote